MNAIVTPGVPELSDEWIAIRTQHLVDEVTTPSPKRTRRLVLASFGGGAAAVTALVVGLLGPWATPAFAGWSAQPTTPSADQLSTAEAACSTLAGDLANGPGQRAPATLPALSLSDVRGPYSLLVYGSAKPALCVLGNGLSSLNEDGASIGSITATPGAKLNQVVHVTEGVTTNPSSATPPAPGAAVVDISDTTDVGDKYFSVVEGAVGSKVSGATVVLSDGSSVVTTVENGLFAAWWPGPATVSSIQVTTTAGVN